MNASAVTERTLPAGVLRMLTLVVGLFLILIVNREFGVADNGDFLRYTASFASKPVELDVNWPANDTADWHYRFFKQPLNYWTANEAAAGNTWFTSAALFWSAGNVLGDALFNESVVNTRYSGLPFFLIQAFLFVALVQCIRVRTLPIAVVAAAAFLPLTDARLSAYFNSYYAESVPILALLATFSFFLARAFLDRETPHTRRLASGLGIIAAVMLCLAVVAKRQYLYFALPALVAIYYVAFVPWNAARTIKMAAFAATFVGLVGSVAALTYANRVNNPAEANAARITSYHAMYFGMLPHSQDKARMLSKLELPADSIRLIGKSVWGAESLKLVEDTPNINMRTFAKAIWLDPIAFVKSMLTNAKEIGNFDIPLGMVYGANQASPPSSVTLTTGLFTRMSGLALLFVGTVLASAMMLFKFGLPAGRHEANRLLALILLVVLSADVMISTFDGQQEARKHVLVGSLACALIFLQAIASLTHVAAARMRG